MPRSKKQRLKRRKDGRFACRYKDRWFYGQTEDEALQARDEYKRTEGQARLIPGGEQTLAEYAASWFPVHKADIRDSTYAAYASTFSTAWKALLPLPLQDITTEHIAAAFADMRNLSTGRIAQARFLLKEVLDSAVDAEYIQRNPCRATSIKPPKGTHGTHRAITPEERRLIETVPHRLQIAAMVMLYAGLRRGEVVALTAEDIDLENGVIRVSKAASFAHGKTIVGEPKTQNSRRFVPITSILRPFLQNAHGYLCPSASGGLMTHSAFKAGWINYTKALSFAAKRPVSIRAHDLRHSYCTMLRDAGVDIKQAMLWMGHVNERMILRVYDHAGATREQQAILQVEALIRSQNGSQAEGDGTATVDK